MTRPGSLGTVPTRLLCLRVTLLPLAWRSVEVEEDVVLLIYGGPNAPSELRSQRIRVLHDPPRLVPA